MTAAPTPSLKSPYASGFRRAAALACDLFLLLLVAVALHKVFFSFFVYSIIGQLVFWAYFTGFESSKKQATPGKLAFGIYVGSEGGGRLSLPRALKRFLLFVLPFLPATVFMLSDRYAAFNDQLRALGEAGDRHAVFILLHTPDTLYMAQELKPLLIIGLVLSILFYLLPIAMIPQKTGLHDLGAHARVFKKDGGGLKSWFSESYGVETDKRAGK